MSTLIVSSKAVAHSDLAATNDPRRKHFDWTQDRKVPCMNPKSDEEQLASGAVFSFFNGTVATSLDNTTAFDVTRSPLGGNRYRFTNSGGTAPVLRTNRGLTLNTQTLSVLDNGDGSATMTLGGGSWGATAAGDSLFLPGPQTGDGASPFNVLNQGFWVVLAVISSTVLQVTRPSSMDYSVSAETQTIASNSQVVALSPTGVQVGDQVSISAAFSLSTQRTFTIDAVTDSWFEVVSASIIPLETGKTPGTTGMVFYTEAKKFVRIEADQIVAIRINGMVTDNIKIQPDLPGSVDNTGWQELYGPVWSLTVVNKSAQVANVVVFSAE